MTDKERRALAKRFEKLRGDRSYREFAKDTGVSLSLLQRYETSAGLPSVENLIVIALGEGVTIDWLLLGK